MPLEDEDSSSIQAYLLEMTPAELRAFAFGVLFARLSLDDDVLLSTVASAFRLRR